jgi:FHA domain
MEDRHRRQTGAGPAGGDQPAPARAVTPRELKHVIETERTGVPFLLYRDQDAAMCLLALESERAVTIGRAQDVGLQLSWDPNVSSVHAEIVPIGRQWLIIDEGVSRNGTFVNSERLTGRRRLCNGDIVRVGRTSLAFHDSGAEAISGTIAIDTEAGSPSVTEAQQRVLVALCRPYRDRDSFVTPPTNQVIADELFLSVEAVKTHLRELYRRFELEQLPQNQKRVRLVERALQLGLAGPRNA